MEHVDQKIVRNLAENNKVGVAAGDFTANQDIGKRDLPADNLPGGAQLLGKDTGFVIGSRGPELLRLDTDSHFVTIAKTGGGKGRSVAIPNLLVHPGSVLSIEIGGATLNETIDFRRHILGQEIHVFDPHDQTKEPCLSINFLDPLDPDSPAFESEVKLLVDCIMQMPDGTQEDNPYFRSLPASLIKSLIIYLKTASEEEVPLKDRHLPKVAELLGQYGSERFNELMVRFATDTGKYRRTLNRVGNYLSGEGRDENKNSVISSASNWMEFAEDVTLASHLKTSDFSLADLRNKKITIYMVMKDASLYEVCHPFLRLMLDQTIYLTPNKGDAGRSFKTEDRILIMADEFTQLGKLKSVQQGMLTTRQKGITLWAIFQDVGALRSIYGREIASSFLGNAGCIQTFAVNDEDTAEFISKRLGKHIAYIPSESVSYSVSEAESESDSVSDAKGDTTSTQSSFSDGTTEGTNKSYNVSHMSSTTSALSGFSPGTSTRGTTSGDSYGSSWSKQRTVGDSKGTTTSQQKTTTKGSTKGITKSRTLTLTYNVQIVPRMDVSDVYEALNTGSNQILFIATQGLYLSILEGQSKYDQVPLLRARSYGPCAPAFPEPLRPLKGPKELTLQKITRLRKLSLPENLHAPINFKYFPVVDVNKASVFITKEGNAISVDKLFSAYHKAAEELESNPKSGHAKKREQALRKQIISATSVIVRNSAKEVERTEPLIRSVNTLNSSVTKSITQNARVIEKAASQVTQTADQLRSLKEGIASHHDGLKEYAQALVHDSKIDGVFYSEIPSFKRYAEFYHYLRDVWSKELEVPHAPSVENISKYMPKLPNKRFDELISADGVIGGQTIQAAAVQHVAPQSYVASVSPPSIQEHLTKWTTWVRPHNKNNKYTSEEMNEVIDHLEGELTPSARLKRMFSFRSGPSTKTLKQDLRFFIQAQERILRKINKEVISDLTTYNSALVSENRSIFTQESSWSNHASVLARKAYEIQLKDTGNKEAASSLNRDIDIVSNRSEALSAANAVLIGERIKKVGQVSSWGIWSQLEDQTKRIESSKPAPSDTDVLATPQREDLSSELRLGIEAYQHPKL